MLLAHFANRRKAVKVNIRYIYLFTVHFKCRIFKEYFVSTYGDYDSLLTINYVPFYKWKVIWYVFQINVMSLWQRKTWICLTETILISDTAQEVKLRSNWRGISIRSCKLNSKSMTRVDLFSIWSCSINRICMTFSK